MIEYAPKGAMSRKHRTLEHDGLLWDDCKAASHIAQLQSADVNAVHHDGSFCQLNEPEQRHHQRAFT